MSEKDIPQEALRAKPWDDDAITSARQIAVDLPLGRDRRKIVDMLWEFDVLAAHNHKVNMDRQIGEFTIKDTRRVNDSADPPLVMCSYCGTLSDEIESDHIVAKSLGGPDDETNRTPACRRCNGRKSNKPFLVWIMEIGGAR